MSMSGGSAEAAGWSVSVKSRVNEGGAEEKRLAETILGS